MSWPKCFTKSKKAKCDEVSTTSTNANRFRDSAKKSKSGLTTGSSSEKNGRLGDSSSSWQTRKSALNSKPRLLAKLLQNNYSSSKLNVPCKLYRLRIWASTRCRESVACRSRTTLTKANDHKPQNPSMNRCQQTNASRKAPAISS